MADAGTTEFPTAQDIDEAWASEHEEFGPESIDDLPEAEVSLGGEVAHPSRNLFKKEIGVRGACLPSLRLGVSARLPSLNLGPQRANDVCQLGARTAPRFVVEGPRVEHAAAAPQPRKSKVRVEARGLRGVAGSECPSAANMSSGLGPRNASP